jgi:predicted permease
MAWNEPIFDLLLSLPYYALRHGAFSPFNIFAIISLHLILTLSALRFIFTPTNVA